MNQTNSADDGWLLVETMTPQYILGDVISGAIISGKAKANAEWMLQMMQTARTYTGDILCRFGEENY